MNKKALADIARKMRDIDFAMLVTHGPRGHITARPMSNNREVKYQGDSYYFTWEGSQMVRDIERDPKVALLFQGTKRLLGKPGIYISVDGLASVLRDRRKFTEHWTKGLTRWFEQGVETPGMVMIKVQAKRLHYWDGEEEGDIKVE
jgi:general stress protein 26